MDIRRKIDGTLSEGRGIQLLWISIIIVFCFLVFWGLSHLLFDGNQFRWQDIIALFLDPGVFGGETDKHDGFRLIITFCGMFLLAAVLISIVSNIFENISTFYEKGEKRYHFKRHILIIGSNDNMLIGLLKELGGKAENCKKQIVVMTSRPVAELRNEVESNLDDDKLFKRITFYYDRRDNEESLKRANVRLASIIYIIGENNEKSIDSLNIKCLYLIRKVFNESKEKTNKGNKGGLKFIKKQAQGQIQKPSTTCFVILTNQATLKEYELGEAKPTKEDTKDEGKKPVFTPEKSLVEEIMNINECVAEDVLKHSIIKEINNDKNYDEDRNHVVIFGLTELGKAIATTIAYSFHFGKGAQTIITIIEKDEERIQEYITLYKDLFDITGFTIYKEGEPIRTKADGPKSSPDPDIVWNFVNSYPTASNVLSYLDEIGNKQKIFIYLCNDDISKNLTIKLCLRNISNNVVIFANFIDNDENVINISPSRSLASLNIFSSTNLNFKKLLIDRIGRGEELFKLCNTDSDWNSTTVSEKQRYLYLSFTSCWEIPIKYKITVDYVDRIMSIGDKYSLEKTAIYTNNGKSEYFRRAEEVSVFEEQKLKEMPSKLIPLLQKQQEEPSILSSFLFEACNYPADWLIPSFLDELYKHITNTKTLSRPSIDALYLIITRTIVAIRYSNDPFQHLIGGEVPLSWEEYTSVDKHNSIKKKARKILEFLSEQNNPTAQLKLALLLQKGDTSGRVDMDRINNLFISATSTLINDYGDIPDSFFEGFSIDYVRDIYEKTKSPYYLDWILANELSNTFVLDLKVTEIENYVKEINKEMSEGQIYLMLGSLHRLDSSLLGMWLTKAIKSSSQNSPVRQEAYLKLGDIYHKGKYYEAAFRLNPKNEDAITKYGRCLYWGWCGISENKEIACKIGYNPKSETEEFLRDREEDEYYKAFADDCDNENLDDTGNSYEEFIKDIQNDISTWEKDYPEIPHPYDNLIIEYKLDQNKYTVSGHNYEIKKILTPEEENEI